MNVYVASSWRNGNQPACVALLREAGHDVYDFRNPAPGESGFAWTDIDPDWKGWSAPRFRAALRHPVAQHGYSRDIDALERADAVVLLLPCGRSAHLEAGYAAGRGKLVIGYLVDGEPELMYLLCSALVTNIEGLLDALAHPERLG